MSGQIVNRFEWKYLVSGQDYQLLRRLFSSVLNPDAHAGPQGSYPVRSVYFDTPCQSAYHTRNAGLAERRKIRLRLYDPAQEWVKLECKGKRGNAQRKETVRLSRSEAEALLCGDRDFLTHGAVVPLPEQLAHAFLEAPLLPVVLVEYDREAYVLPAWNVRVNFDMRMRVTASTLDLFVDCPPYVPLAGSGDIVLEVKHGGTLPTFMLEILSSFDPVRTSFSKYCIAREAAF